MKNLLGGNIGHNYGRGKSDKRTKYNKLKETIIHKKVTPFQRKQNITSLRQRTRKKYNFLNDFNINMTIGSIKKFIGQDWRIIYKGRELLCERNTLTEYGVDNVNNIIFEMTLEIKSVLERDWNIFIYRFEICKFFLFFLTHIMRQSSKSVGWGGGGVK